MIDRKFFANKGPLNLEQIVKHTGAKIKGNLDQQILFEDVSGLKEAKKTDISFLANNKYLDSFASSQAGACFVQDKYAEKAPKEMILLITDNPYKAYAIIANMFYPLDKNIGKIANSAKIGNDCNIGQNVFIGENVVIGNNVTIGNNSYISHNSFIGDNVIIGNDCKIGSNVTVEYAHIKNKVLIHNGVRIGQDGFGFASDRTGHLKVPQLGRVIIGNDVEIGANTTIDRGAGPDTEIGDMTKIDNLVQIGHNVKIGKGCLIVSQVGISGSTIIEDFVVLGGQVGVVGHIKIGQFTQIAAQSGVMNDLPAKSIMGGTPAIAIKDWHRQTIYLKKLIKKK